MKLSNRVCAFALLAVFAIASNSFTIETKAETKAETKKQKSEKKTYAIFETNMGTFEVLLNTKRAPITTANFIGLAKGTKEWTNPKTGKKEKEKPFFDGLIFHRVISGFMLQGGCPMSSGRSGPGYSIKDEFHPELKHSKPGILSMANSGPNTGGSQFFVTVAPTPHLDNKHAIFGEVTKGIDIVMKISKIPTMGRRGGNRPLQDVVMKTVKIVERDPDAKKDEKPKAQKPAKKDGK